MEVGDSRSEVGEKEIPLQKSECGAAGILSRRIFISFPSLTMVVRALWAEVGLTASSSSMSESFLRPMMRSCASVGRGVPGVEIVEIFLDHDVAAALEGGVFIADQDGLGDGLAARVFGAVDEAEEVAVVEIAEAVNFVGGGLGNRRDDPIRLGNCHVERSAGKTENVPSVPVVTAFRPRVPSLPYPFWNSPP